MKVIERQAVRAIIINPALEILLMQIRNPANGEKFWICPGGGIQAGEDLLPALRRELGEELGLFQFEAQHQLHKRHHIFNWRDKRISQHEIFFALHTNKFEPVMADAVEIEVLQEFRWWPLHELHEIAHSVNPRELKQIVQDYLQNGPPKTALTTETLVD